MKIVVYGAARRVGALVDGEVVDLNWAYAKRLRETGGAARPYAHADAFVPADLAGFIEEGRSALDRAREALDHQRSHNPDPVGPCGEQIVHGPGVRLHAPLASAGSRIAMAGGNYADHLRGFLARARGTDLSHAEATARIRSGEPWGFWKLPGTVIGTGEALRYPERARLLDYEGEVAVVIGPGGRDVPRSRAVERIWGYTLVNDWTVFGAHERQRALSFNLAKNFDTSISMGPCLVVDEIEDPQAIEFETRIDGELRQKGSTGDMVFSFAEYLEVLTRDLTFRPGDVLGGGSPVGTAGDSSQYTDGAPSSDERFVHVGQEVVVSSPLIGELRNAVHGKAEE
ncbi:2-keto-4-pentenoate hydratase/2-oxohepta-3-ene-1,7-dioic acid hydratase [Frankia sp. Hr75.2]|nr:2-keto-4-pentenoate hydratase/2-oxohepta-3-ene-1,7-dioic acid hydratase [Frankia sp. Hr75.2]